jgi:hypothetical protein
MSGESPAGVCSWKRHVLADEISIDISSPRRSRASSEPAAAFASARTGLGHPLEKVINKDAMANPGCLTWYLDFAAKHLQKNAGAA